MYSKISHGPEVVRWSDTLKRMKPQGKRISPYTALEVVEKKVLVKSPNLKKSTSMKAALLQKAIFSFGHFQQQPVLVEQETKTPELSINEEIFSSASSSVSSLDDEEDEDCSLHINDIVQQILAGDAGSIDTDADDEEEEEEEQDDDEVIEQALCRMLTTKAISQTCPNILELSRPLPALPSESGSESDLLSKSVELLNSSNYNSLLQKYVSANRLTRAAANKGQVGLKRAVTWLSVPIKKVLGPVQNLGLKTGQPENSYSQTENASDQCNSPGLSSASLAAFQKEEESGVNQQALTKKLVYGTEADHFAFLRSQLEHKTLPALQNNTASLTNKKTLVLPKRIMYCRVMQIINLASTRECEYELFIQHNNVTMATKSGVLRKIEKNFSADRPQEEAVAFEIEEPFSLNFIVAARHTNTVLRDGLAKMGLWPISASSPKATSSELPVQGFACLNFENKMNILDQGVSRVRLTKPVDKSSNRWMNIELLIDIKVEQITPAVVNRFPWSYTMNQHSAAASYHSAEEVACTAHELAVSQTHCKNGDYLTFYTRNMAHPTWKRYWVTLEDGQLILHDFTFKTDKASIGSIPLSALQAVNKPSMDDCENVGVARKTGIVMFFDRSRAILTGFVRLDNSEDLEGKAYVYGDSEENTKHWRNTLHSRVTVNKEENQIQSIEDGVDLRFLW